MQQDSVRARALAKICWKLPPAEFRSVRGDLPDQPSILPMESRFSGPFSV
jgi:hypothetical protein